MINASTFILKSHTRGCIETARVEELECEINVYIAEKHQYISLFLPCMSTDVQSSATGKLFVHRDKGEVSEILFTEKKIMTA